MSKTYWITITDKDCTVRSRFRVKRDENEMHPAWVAFDNNDKTDDDPLGMIGDMVESDLNSIEGQDGEDEEG